MRRRRLRDSDADLRWVIFLALVPFLLLILALHTLLGAGKKKS